MTDFNETVYQLSMGWFPEQIKNWNEVPFEKLKNFITLTPTYVFDIEQDSYVLYGKLDCHYAIKADSGEMAALNAL